MLKRKKTILVSFIGYVLTAFMLVSCAAPTYLSSPIIYTPVREIKNVFSFGIQNMDEKAKVDNNTITCHYDGFDFTYEIDFQNMTISFMIVNNSNKSLIIDKSKSYVLYDGYSTQLFKDVRSSRSTTFNNVQDAINNVQTNEAGVSMTIPPYSKWELPKEETNIRGLNKFPSMKYIIGIHSISQFDKEQEIVEFVIPYSFDYSLAKWETCRNRIFINSVEVTKREFKHEGGTLYASQTPLPPNRLSVKEYQIIGSPDYTEANRIDELNRQIYLKHRRKVRASHWCWGIITLPLIWPPLLMWATGCEHQPPKYGR